jgi:hypothetical protein
MAKLNASRTAQYLMNAEFVFNFDDTMNDITAASKDFGKTNIAATSFDIINVPEGAVIVGGELVVETAFDTASYAVIIGDSAVANRYLATADRKAVGRTALVPTGYRTAGENIRIQITNADVCTTGKATVRIQYVVTGRANEIVPN